MGQWMDEVTRGWLIYELTNSAVQLGLVRGIQVIPYLLLSPVAGSAADRYSRKTQVVVAQVCERVDIYRDGAADFYRPDQALACLRHRLPDGNYPSISAAGKVGDGFRCRADSLPDQCHRPQCDGQQRIAKHRPCLSRYAHCHVRYRRYILRASCFLLLGDSLDCPASLGNSALQQRGQI